VQQLSIFQMIIHAGPMVKFVMLLLLAFSLGSWTIIIMKYRTFKKAREESAFFVDIFWKSKNLADAYKTAQETTASPEAAIFTLGFNELQKLGRSRAAKQMGEETLEMQLAGMDNLKRTLRKAEDKEMIRLSRSLSFLATTGSATPFIGLFGTVWGIMHSFRGLANSTQATLSTVAPGISEALIATAMGLFAAIPAVLAYNRFAAKVDVFGNRYDTFVDEFSSILSRQAYALRSREKSAG
jgi:biopolymer transport protein TolQ